MFHKLITFGIATTLAVAAIAPPSALAQGAGIHIFAASYGLPGRAMPVTGLVADRCEGQWRCGFHVRNGFFGDDPVVGAPKQVVVYWSCGEGRNRSAFREYTWARLHC